MSSAAHPSYLELDRLYATGGEAAAASLSEHVVACAECREHLAELARSAGEQPAWLGAMALAAPRPRPRRRLAIPAAAVVAALSMAALLALTLRPAVPTVTGAGEGAEALREKGEPAVAVYVLRDRHVIRWDGREPLRAGDRLRLEVAGAGYAHVAVATPSAGGGLALLYTGSLEARAPVLLPASWEVDRVPGPEILHVVLRAQRHPRRRGGGGGAARGGRARRLEAHAAARQERR